MEIKDKVIPKRSACSFFTFPVGIGLKQVLVITASISESYHIFKQPAAPAPIATRIIPIIAFEVSIVVFEVIYPTAQVKITRDITLGFNNKINDFKKEFISIVEGVRCFNELVDNFNQHSK